jgi:phosphoglycerate dehydrogenase-like enzyme
MKLLVASPWVNRIAEVLGPEFPEVEFIASENPETLVDRAAEAEAAFGPISPELFKAATNLRWIQSTSAGVEWMGRIPELAKTDIIVTNTRGAHASTIAEHAFGMLVFLARGFNHLYESQKRREWQRPLVQDGVGLAGMTMGVIGLGNIGRAVAKRAEAFDMHVIAVDVNEVPKPDYVAEVGLLNKIPDLMRRSDVVAVCTPITDETRGMIDEELLKLMKPSAYLLVLSRGGIIDEPILAQMLRDGELAGAGLDVTAIEPLPEDNELWDAPNIIITPHSSPSSSQTGNNVTAILRDNLKRYLAGEELTNQVDKQRGY